MQSIRSKFKEKFAETLNAVFPKGLGNCTVEKWSVAEFNRLALQTQIFTN